MKPGDKEFIKKMFGEEAVNEGIVTVKSNLVLNGNKFVKEGTKIKVVEPNRR